jgi:hypothetical protein
VSLLNEASLRRAKVRELDQTPWMRNRYKVGKASLSVTAWRAYLRSCGYEVVSIGYLRRLVLYTFEQYPSVWQSIELQRVKDGEPVVRMVRLQVPEGRIQLRKPTEEEARSHRGRIIKGVARVNAMGGRK